ncbi:MAG: M36 family metallopeptidase [Saprospiraceae bacterium]
MIRHFTTTRFLFVAFMLSCSFQLATAQADRSAREKALSFLHLHAYDLGLTNEDVAETNVNYEYTTKHNGVTHVWVQQQHLGIPVFNGLIGLNVSKKGEVFTVGHQFVRDLHRNVNTTLPSLSAYQALELGLEDLGLDGYSVPSLKEKINDQNWIFEGAEISRNPIKVSACYVKTSDGKARLAWTLVIDQKSSNDIWNLRVDAQTGLVLDKFNQTNYCKVGSFDHEEDHCVEAKAVNTQQTQVISSTPNMLVDESYNVFALPLLAPNEGNRSIVVNPYDPMASPYGWLDIDGQEGAEFTYTRGNNVWAFDDRANDNTPDPTESADAGPTLAFDFPYDANSEAPDNALAAIANLFYMNNMMHDFTYRYGFDEEGGNFQTNNYGHPGEGTDAVLAQALDGSGVNNANFATPTDGNPGRMQMYLWNATGGGIVRVNEPGVVSGSYYGGQGGWGGSVTDVPLTADVVFVNDGIEPTVGCTPPLNDVTGKILMIDRGECEFGEKALLAEQAGAVACIICDHEAPPKAGFGAGAVGGQVTIPAVWMKKADCSLLRQYAGTELNISLVQPSSGGGPAEVDGDFDNGIIAHEFAHGISNRLTGGPTNPCLGNSENMGEGWSDFFSLVTTVKPGDSGTTKRGVGTFVYRQGPDDNGIRRYPYTTDMSVNPLTYASVAENPETHALGEVWTAMLWDLYWAMVEKYGYDADINNPNSGNARAIFLVMDGMKMQPCYPGFETGRDAIMLADKMNYDGADTCLISSVFARRGLGYLALQNDPELAADGYENFEPIPTCVKELKIKKVTSTPLLVPGDNAEFVITVTNHKDDAAPDVVVTDEIPTGMTLVTASNGGVVNGNFVEWHLGTMQSGEVITLTYTMATSPFKGSVSFYQDIMDEDFDWVSYSNNQDNIVVFTLQNIEVHSGSMAWFAPESTSAETDFVLEPFAPVAVTGSKPILRFWHKYNTEVSADPGFLEFMDVDEANPLWRRVTDEVTFRNGYPAKVAYGGAFAFPNHYGFSGNSNGWVQSYFDLSAYAGKNLVVRFRFGTDDNTGPASGGDGYWYVDELEMLDMFNYDTEACVSSGSDMACSRVPEAGVIMEEALISGTHDAGNSFIPMSVQPNPASDMLYVKVGADINETVNISIVSPEGRLIMNKQVQNLNQGQVTGFDVQQVPAGLYIVQLESATFKSHHKVVIK